MYVDGYNLYYGRLRNTAFKWLDVVDLFDSLVARRDQNEKVVRLHLFTAPALASFATHGDASVNAQSAYHRALMTRHPERFEIIYGKHSYDRSGTLLPSFVVGQAYDRTIRSRVWKLEEKKTDVNLALRIYRDACKGLYDRIILMSNDSDAEPVLVAGGFAASLTEACVIAGRRRNRAVTAGRVLIILTRQTVIAAIGRNDGFAVN